MRIKYYPKAIRSRKGRNRKQRGRGNNKTFLNGLAASGTMPQGRGAAKIAGIPANKKGEFVTKGSIAMQSWHTAFFIVFPLPEGVDPGEYALKIAEEDPRIDKWGPAGCFVLKEAQTTGVRLTKKKAGNEKYDHLARATVLYCVRGCI